MLGQESYINAIRSSLNAALCLRDFPSTLFEKDNKPFVELTGYSSKINNLVMKPIYLSRNKKERFLIEPSINSCRISFTIKKSDEMERLIVGKFSSMVAARAELFQVIRRKPIKDYDVTFLVTSDLLERYNKDFVIDLIVSLVGTLEKDLLEVKLNINTEARVGATFYLSQLANPTEQELY